MIRLPEMQFRVEPQDFQLYYFPKISLKSLKHLINANINNNINRIKFTVISTCYFAKEKTIFIGLHIDRHGIKDSERVQCSFKMKLMKSH